MKRIFTLLLLLLSIEVSAQFPICPLYPDSSCIYMPTAGVLVPSYDSATGTNTWTLLNNGDHAPIGADSIAVFGDQIVLYFTDTFWKVNSLIFGIDENMGRSNFAPPGAGTYYTNTVYHAGASVYTSYAKVTISQLCANSGLIRYNGTNWVHSSNSTLIGRAPYNASSKPYTMNYNNGVLTVHTAPAMSYQQFPLFTQYSPNGENLQYRPAVETFANGMFKIHWWDDLNDTTLTSSVPPTNLGVLINTGATYCTTDPRYTPFPTGSNIWFIGWMEREH